MILLYFGTSGINSREFARGRHTLSSSKKTGRSDKAVEQSWSTPESWLLSSWRQSGDGWGVGPDIMVEFGKYFFESGIVNSGGSRPSHTHSGRLDGQHLVMAGNGIGVKFLPNMVKVPFPTFASPQWRIQNFIMGKRTVEGRGLGRGLTPLPRKNLNFYLKMVSFGAF